LETNSELMPAFFREEVIVIDDGSQPTGSLHLQLRREPAPPQPRKLISSVKQVALLLVIAGLKEETAALEPLVWAAPSGRSVPPSPLFLSCERRKTD
jgi:hypothetical protein